MAENKQGENKQVNDKKGIHWPYYFDVEVECLCGNKFTINTTEPWPIKVETCYACHPAFNKDKVVKKVVKWRMEKFLEKQKKMQQLQQKKS